MSTELASVSYKIFVLFPIWGLVLILASRFIKSPNWKWLGWALYTTFGVMWLLFTAISFKDTSINVNFGTTAYQNWINHWAPICLQVVFGCLIALAVFVKWPSNELGYSAVMFAVIAGLCVPGVIFVVRLAFSFFSSLLSGAPVQPLG